MWRALLVVAVAGCEPLSGYTVEDRAGSEVVVLPMRCLDSVARTTGGRWVCRTADGIFTSSGDALSSQLFGEFAPVGGGAVWTWVSPYAGAVLIRYEDEPLSGGLMRSPDAGFDWQRPGMTRAPIRTVVARERELVLSAPGLQVLAARDGGFTLLSSAASPFSNNGVAGFGAAEVLFQQEEFLWASGPGTDGPLLCAFNFNSSEGVMGSGQCSRLPPNRYGPGSGGLWVSAGGSEPIQFFRPILGLQRGLVLPGGGSWSFGAVPWATYPDSATLIVPRVDGDRLIIDRYQASAGHVWAGADEKWVYEVGASTTVRAR